MEVPVVIYRKTTQRGTTMDKPKILIADSTDDFRDTLADTLHGAYHVRTAVDGLQAMQLLRSFLPDILVLDLMLPELDGITLLQKAAESGIRPVVLAATRYVSDYTLHAADRLGIAYLMIKPCDVAATAARIADISQRIKTPVFSHPEPRSTVSNTLLRLGIPTKLRGYSYLREAILIMAQSPGQSITKELYPAVAIACGATATQIERSIRSAVSTAWSQSDRQIWQLYFPPDNTGTIPKPTTASFISRLADDISKKQFWEQAE